MPHHPEVIAFLKKTFNANAADVRAVIEEYKARFVQLIPGTRCYNIRGVDDAKVDEFIAKFGALPGVDGIYKQAPAAPPAPPPPPPYRRY